jgi:hypothetical protein
MTLSEIEKKIQSYNLKLNSKRTISGKSRPIKGHLKSYILKEIKKLTELKNSLLNPIPRKVYVTWDHIIFNDGKIAIKYENIFTDYYPMEFSRKSFEDLKAYFKLYDLPKIIAEINQNKIISIINHYEIVKVFNLLSFREDFSCSLLDDLNINVLDTIKKHNAISNQEIFTFFNVKDKSEFIEILCNLQSLNYKIVPLFEKSIISYDINSEDSFLFTFLNDKAIYIVWESSKINRATYIFKTTKSNYDISIQIIFNYLSSNQTALRKKLRNSLNTKYNRLGLIRVINHKSINDWKNDIFKTTEL